MNLTLSDLIDLWGQPEQTTGTFSLSEPLGKVITDTRTMSEGDFFVPLIGDQFDGHMFLAQAFKNGAQGAIVSVYSSMRPPSGGLYWLVEDTLTAYQDLASVYRSKFHIPIVAITGSSGKTTTREMIRSVLKPIGPILSTKENNNNDIGVPQTLLEVRPQHRAVVIEMGMRGQGEIRRLSNCSKPDIAVITNIGTAHIGRLGSKENIAKAKCEITSSLNPNGLVVIPAGDQLLEKTLLESWTGRITRVALWEGIKQPVDNANNKSCKIDLNSYYDKNNSVLELDGYNFNLALKGRHNAQNFLLSLAVAKELDVSWNNLRQVDIKLPFGRSNRILINGIRVLDETYNASPEAVFASLDLLREEPGRHFAVLGTMLELGSYSEKLHRQVLEKSIECSLDGLIFVTQGMEAEILSEYSNSFKRFLVVDDCLQSYNHLKNWLHQGDTLLLKGSRKLMLDRLIDKLKQSLN